MQPTSVLSNVQPEPPGRWLLFPRFEERLDPEFYRIIGKIRLYVVCAVLLANVGAWLSIDQLQMDESVYWKLTAFHVPTHALVAVLTLWLWKGSLSALGLRRVTYACMLIECVTALVTMWAYGTVNSHMVIFSAVFILVYRLAYDFRIGATAFAVLVLGQWGIVIAETSGWIPVQPTSPDGNPAVYEVAARGISAMIFITIMLGLTFAVAHWAVARMRYKDVAIRLLRETLIAKEPGQVGRHTGRTLCDTYVVGALIGSGGMGEVYRGHHRRTRRELAIKLLHPHLVTDDDVLKRFRREAEVTGTLGSEHIVQIIDVDSEHGEPFLVLEYLEGESLGARIGRGPLPPSEVVEAVSQLGLALDAAHAAGVVHRDLKPENVFLCRRADGSLLVKVLDFGVSKISGNATALTKEVAILGTPDFMSPEQAVGFLDEIDQRADVFALGGCIYNALTGQRPFRASSVPALLRRICEEEPVPLRTLCPELPIDAGHVVAIAMAKQADERYASAGELARDLGAAFDGTLDRAIAERAQHLTRGRPAGETPVPRTVGAAAAATTAVGGDEESGRQLDFAHGLTA